MAVAAAACWAAASVTGASVVARVVVRVEAEREEVAKAGEARVEAVPEEAEAVEQVKAAQRAVVVATAAAARAAGCGALADAADDLGGGVVDPVTRGGAVVVAESHFIVFEKSIRSSRRRWRSRRQSIQTRWQRRGTTRDRGWARSCRW